MSDNKIQINPVGRLSRFADLVMSPVMRWGAGRGFWDESPQETHFWNNHHLDPQLSFELMKRGWMNVKIPADPSACKRGWFRFHLPRFGGWRNYIVVEPTTSSHSKSEWYVGWMGKGFLGISRIPIVGPVRLLRSPEDAYAFGITSVEPSGRQISLKIVGEGTIGDGGKFCQVPLR